MLNLDLSKTREQPLRLLFLGAHCDDIEIGCGGTVLRLAREFPDAVFHWVVFASDSERKQEAEASARAFLAGVADKQIVIESFQESYFPYHGRAIKDFFEGAVKPIAPDLVFTHYRDDRHQDHRIISDLAWNTFRDHMILEYEIVKYDGDFGTPNFFVPLARDTSRRKVSLVLEHFPSQRGRQWFSADAFEAVARLRGIECNAPDGHAEAYYARKLVF
ncbi:MAG: PIG-L deacetylase family protein [Myxococcota bacterium]